MLARLPACPGHLTESRVLQSAADVAVQSPFNACSMTRAAASYEHDLLFRSPSDRIASYYSPNALGLTKLVVKEKTGGSGFGSTASPSKQAKTAQSSSPQKGQKGRSDPKPSMHATSDLDMSLPSHQAYNWAEQAGNGDEHHAIHYSDDPFAASESEVLECRAFSRQRYACSPTRACTETGASPEWG